MAITSADRSPLAAGRVFAADAAIAPRASPGAHDQTSAAAPTSAIR
jgi:hypothetical protein